jgi:hypothetical protein
MSMFDPYEKWLGIPKDQRPLTCFLLLGIEPDEEDAGSIEQAAIRQAKLVRRHKEGPHADVCARLLKEIQQARAILLDPDKRARYEAQLRAKLRKKPVPQEEEESEDFEVVEEADDEDEPEEEEEAPRRKNQQKGAKAVGRRRDKQERKKSSLVLPLVICGVALLLLCAGGGVVGFALFFGHSPETKPAAAPVAVVTPQPAPVPPPPTAAVKATAPAPPPTAKEAAPAPAPPVPPPSPPPAPPPPPPPLPPPPAKFVKLPVPSDADQARAEKALKEKYKADYAKIRPDKPDDKLPLAAKLLQPGREDRKDPAGWFVLLREARDLAAQADHPRLAVEAIDEIDKWFIIDAPVMKLKTLTAIGETVKENAIVKLLARAALRQVKQAITADNFDTAAKLAEFAGKVLEKVKADPDDLERVTERKRDVADARKEFTPVAEARKKLKEKPDDPDANLVVGKHLCYVQSNWDDGLPHLAKSGDAVLKALAQKDLARPAGVKEELDVADGWWALGKVQRALYWYDLVEPKTAGEEKTKVFNRIKEGEQKESAGQPRFELGSFYGRANPEDRVLLLREGGGSMRSEEAVERGLEWLAKHQDRRTGGWGTDSFTKTSDKCNCSEPGEKHDVAGTAFGLLPFLGAGYTHKQGRYAATVARGLSWLINEQLKLKEGQFSDNMYENALATIAMCEAFGLSRDGKLRDSAQAGLNYIVKAQNSRGGWGYSPGALPGDTSVTGWQFAALKAGYFAHLSVPTLTFAQVTSFLASVESADGTGFGYNDKSYKNTTAAVGLLCLEFLGKTPSDPTLTKGIDRLLQEYAFTKASPNIYLLFYATQAMHHYGGRKWQDWNNRTRDMLIDLQDQGSEREHSHQKGSWSPAGDPFAATGGRLMFTSLAIITLENYYYSVPLNGYGPAVVKE